jgi:hypothetical protein
MKNNKIISTGWNYCIFMSSLDPHPFFRDGKKVSIHAEEHALRRADPRMLKGASLYVIRKSYDGNLANSKPCKRCESIIFSCMKKYGLKNVFYST